MPSKYEKLLFAFAAVAIAGIAAYNIFSFSAKSSRDISYIKNTSLPAATVSVESDNGDSNIININTATADELCTLSGIGETKAAAIIEYRDSNGGFAEIDEIMNVKGIGEATFAKIKGSICI